MQVTPYRVAWWRTWITRPLVKFTLRSLFHILAPVRISGRGNIPFGKPYLLAINHVSLFDPPFIISCWPEMVESMGAIEIWSRPGQNVLARLYGGIPVRRGEYDRELIEKVVNVLRSGRPLLIAPEGTRSHDAGMARARPGVAFIAEQAGVPVLPVGIVGTTEDFWRKASHGRRPPLEMRIGKPILLPAAEQAGLSHRATRQMNADLVMAHIAGLLPESYRGVYADSAIPPAQAGQ